MQQITATQIMNVGSGNVRLTPDQAKTRLHNLKPIGKTDKAGLSNSGEYEIVNPIQFKAGEKFGFSGEVGKDGNLRDREAEELAKLEVEDRIRAKVQAEEREKYAKSLAAARTELAEEHAAKLAAALAEQEARLRAELAPKVAP